MLQRRQELLKSQASSISRDYQTLQYFCISLLYSTYLRTYFEHPLRNNRRRTEVGTGVTHADTDGPELLRTPYCTKVSLVPPHTPGTSMKALEGSKLCDPSSDRNSTSN